MRDRLLDAIWWYSVPRPERRSVDEVERIFRQLIARNRQPTREDLTYVAHSSSANVPQEGMYEAIRRPG